MSAVDYFSQKMEPTFHIKRAKPLDIAIQLSLIEYYMFSMIQPDEFFNQAWLKNNKEDKSPNITAITKRFNWVSLWVCSSILQCKNLKKRAKILEKFVTIAWVNLLNLEIYFLVLLFNT